MTSNFDAETFVTNMLHNLTPGQVEAVYVAMRKRCGPYTPSTYPYNPDYTNYIAQLNSYKGFSALQGRLVLDAEHESKRDIPGAAILGCKVLDYVAFNMIQLGNQSGAIHAIRYLRARLDCGLGEAKAVVDAERAMVCYTWDQYRNLIAPRLDAFFALESHKTKILSDFIATYSEGGSNE